MARFASLQSEYTGLFGGLQQSTEEFKKAALLKEEENLKLRDSEANAQTRKAQAEAASAQVRRRSFVPLLPRH